MNKINTSQNNFFYFFLFAVILLFVYACNTKTEDQSQTTQENEQAKQEQTNNSPDKIPGIVTNPDSLPEPTGDWKTDSLALAGYLGEWTEEHFLKWDSSRLKKRREADAEGVKRLLEIANQCHEVEYSFNSFEYAYTTSGYEEVMRFLSFIDIRKAMEELCPRKDYYDGEVIFKDLNGDIAQVFQFNILGNCLRIVFEIEGKRYSRMMTQSGIDYFAQSIRQYFESLKSMEQQMKQQVQQQNQQQNQKK